MEKKETLFEKAERLVGDGAKFRVNLTNRYLRINDEYLIKDSEYDGFLGVARVDPDEALRYIESAYREYSNSIPSERTQSWSWQAYFKAKQERELSDEDMMYGERRELAQLRLELLVLCYILNGSLLWNCDWGMWFWQSRNEPGLVLLREWVDGE